MKNRMDTKAPRCYGGALFYKGEWPYNLIINDMNRPSHQNQSLCNLAF